MEIPKILLPLFFSEKDGNKIMIVRGLNTRGLSGYSNVNTVQKNV